MTEPIDNLLAALGVEYEPEPGDLIACAVVVLKVVDKDGCVGLSLRSSDGISWIERLGMLNAAQRIELAGITKEAE